MIHANDNKFRRTAAGWTLASTPADFDAPAPTAKPTKFEAGGTYRTNSICDSNCWYEIKVLSRTAKTVTISEHGRQKTCRLSVYEGVEQFKPHGSYSMCAIIRATDKDRGPKAR